MTVTWNDALDDKGFATREFRISADGARDITGALWLPPEGKTGNTLVCFGHGASGDRYQAPGPHLARRFAQEKHLPVLSLDGPVHGLRKTGPGGRESFFPEFQRESAIREMTAEWHLAIDEVRKLVDVPQLAYFGLSMGSIFGIPFVASRDDVVAATLGLVGVSGNFPHGDEILAAAAGISCPILFLMQLEDELFNREGYLAVFDAFATDNKRLHANPGLHPEIPAEEVDFSFDFLASYIDGTATRRIVNPLAE